MLNKCDLCVFVSNMSFRSVCATSALLFVARSTCESIVCSLRFEKDLGSVPSMLKKLCVGRLQTFENPLLVMLIFLSLILV